MQSLPNPKPNDDPHDIVVIAPDAVRVAPADEEIESLLKEKLRAPSAPSEPELHVPPLRAVPEREPAAAVPHVDTTFRATALNDAPLALRRRSVMGQALRGVAALLMAACIGGAAMAWRYHGDAAQRMIAEWTPVFTPKSAEPAEKTGLAAPAVLAAADVDAANATPPQHAPQPPVATDAAAPAATAAVPPAAVSAAEPQSLEGMARDLANATQQIEQLKASVEQLKASQQQLVAMIADKEKAAIVQNARPKKPVTPPRPVAAVTPAHAPSAALSPRPLRPAAMPIAPSTAAPLPSAAPYVPRQTEPQAQTSVEAINDPELSSVPRPPMPLR